MPLYFLVEPAPPEWPDLLSLATSPFRLLTSPWRFLIAICIPTLSASLVERRLAYSATCSFRVLFSIFRLVMTEQYSTVACVILAKAMDISIVLCTITVLYPPWWEVCWHSRRSACALMKCAWNLVQVFSGSDLARHILQSSWNCLVSAICP